jgi:DNA-binding SARP family transcriptional activator
VGPIPLAQDVFDQFPHGILVFDQAGSLVSANRAGPELLGPLRRRLDGRAPRCCDLFGCGTPGALAETCLAELAAQGEAPLPELRVDLADTAPAHAVWLTIAPFREAGRHFLVEVRAGEARDRRRRSTPKWLGDRRLRVYALGRTRVEGLEGPLEGRWLEQRAGQVLKYLVCERHRVVYPEEITAAVWPHDEAPETGTVRYFVHRLRRHLEPVAPVHGPSSFVIAADGGYRLSPTVLVDADEFEREALAGLAACSEGDRKRAEERLGKAAALYGGDLIADQPNAPWAFDERERLRALAEESLRQLLQIDLAREDLDAALGRLRKLVALEPFDLQLQRSLLTVCLACGRRSEAMRRYKALRARLRDEFDEDLEFDLADVSGPDALQAIRDFESPLGARSG